MKRLRILIPVLLVLGGALAWLAWPTDRSSRGAAPATTNGGDETPAELQAAPPPDSDPTVEAAARTELAREEPAETAPEPAESSLRGHVIDAITGKAVASFPIMVLQPPDPKTTLTTDAEGRFTFPHLRAGAITFVWPDDGRRLNPDHFQPSSFIYGELGHGAGDEIEFGLTQLRPEEVRFELRFRLVLPDGSPAEGARAVLDLGPENSYWRRRYGEPVGSSGIAVFPLTEDEVEWAAEAVATLGEDFVGRAPRMGPPLSPGPWTLELQRGGKLRVRVTDLAGKPANDASVRLRPTGSPYKSSYVPGAPWAGLKLTRYTYRNGEAFFAPLPPISFDVSIHAESLGVERETPAGTVTIEAGREIEWVKAIDVERPVAVAGRVVDEKGEGLAGVHVEIVGAGERGREKTDEEGRFEHVAFLDDRLVVLPDPLGDVYEPAHAEVAFGTTGLEFRRVDVLEERSITLIVVDRASGAPVEKFHLTVHLERPQRTWGSWMGQNGAGHVQAKFQPGVRVLILAQGYLPLDLPLGDMLAAGDVEVPLKLELDRGFRLPVTVLDYLTEEPIAGVRFSAPGAPDAVTDERGVAVLEATFLPESYRLEREGYEPDEFSPGPECVDEDYYLTPDDVYLVLEPVGEAGE